MTAWRFLFISLGVHFLLVFLFGKFQAPLHSDATKDTVVIELAESKSDRKIILPRLMPDDPKSKKQKPKKATVLGPEDREVVEETTGKQTVLGQKKVPLNLQPQLDKIESEDLPPSREKPDDGPGKRKQIAQNRPEFQQQFQAEEHVDGVKENSVTSLNSERFVFSSFFGRIDSQVLPIWRRNVNESLRSMGPQMQRKIAGQQFLTVVDILLDEKGNVKDVVLLKNSGIPQLDQSVLDTFKELTFFPNPPKAMLKEDNRIHLTYAFNVFVERRFLAFQ